MMGTFDVFFIQYFWVQSFLSWSVVIPKSQISEKNDPQVLSFWEFTGVEIRLNPFGKS
jgi:hypothetical protein